MESMPLDENRRAIPWHWIVIGLLVVGHAGVGACIYPLIALNPDNPFLLLAFGLILSHPALFAIWAAFAPQRFYHRFFWSCLLCILVSFADGIGAFYQIKDDFGKIMLFEIAVFFMAFSILLLLRQLFGWQITRGAVENTPPSNYQAYQFGIKHLLILTTITAIGFGLFHSSLVLAPNSFMYPRTILATIASMYILLLIPIFVVPWFILPYRISLIVLIIVTIFILALSDRLAYPMIQFCYPGIHSICTSIFFFQLGAALSVLVTTLVMRFCGFRMIRIRKVAAQAGEA